MTPALSVTGPWPGTTTFGEMNTLYQSAVDSAATAGLKLIARTHLTYNRQELTLFFESTAVVRVLS